MVSAGGILCYMKISDFFTGLLENKKAAGVCAKTIQEYQRLWEKVLIPSGVPDIEINRLKKNDASKILLAGQAHGVFGGQRGIVILRQLLRFIRDEGLNPSVNWWEITVPTMPRKVVEWLDPDEWEKVRSAFDLTSFTGLRDRAYVELLRATGFRPSEALSFSRDQIDWNKKQIRMKNGKPPYDNDIVYLTDECMKYLKLYLDVRNDNFPPVFVSLNGRKISLQNLRRNIQDEMRRAGIKKRIHPYIFRKTFCTTLLFGGADIKTVKDLARHRSERTTLRYYAAVSKSRSRDMHEKIMNDPNALPGFHVEKTVTGKKLLVSESRVPGVPIIITHARILIKNKTVDNIDIDK